MSGNTQPFALMVDLYELTMAYGYLKSGLADRLEAAFHLFFRKNPFGGGYAVACGLARAADFIETFSFSSSDREYLATLRGLDSKRLFDDGFLKYLGKLRFACDVDAVPEGVPVFPHEPLVRVRGPLIQAQILETALLNIFNFHTLIATKAARVVQAARWERVLEFGARRAQGFDGALAASYAAYVGGCSGTSNVLAGKRFGIPVGGTHAHSWVMAFGDELEAFHAYADALPGSCVFLVDTYDTLEGVRNAVEAGKRLRERGGELAGVRIDSGDLAWLSGEARRILDENGFQEAKIFASNDLDETVIESLKAQGARIAVWGVGTRLSTAYDHPALDGVYKLTAVRQGSGAWEDRIKISESSAKISLPGNLQVRRYRNERENIADMIFDERSVPGGEAVLMDPEDAARRKTVPPGTSSEDLLVPVFRKGKRVYDPPPPGVARERTRRELGKFHGGVTRLVNPHRYPVGVERSLLERRDALAREIRGRTKGRDR